MSDVLLQIDGVDTWVAADDPRVPKATLEPAPPVTVTGNQWAFSLSDLGLAGAWMAALAKSKASDQFRVGLIARDTPLVASDPLLARVAGNAGQDGAGKALIDVPTVHAHATGMPL